uniref:TIP41-like protein n=1 Tax=Parascaris equorum TaxID=6256 RepID=A0A914S6P6_PAREQ
MGIKAMHRRPYTQAEDFGSLRKDEVVTGALSNDGAVLEVDYGARCDVIISWRVSTSNMHEGQRDGLEVTPSFLIEYAVRSGRILQSKVPVLTTAQLRLHHFGGALYLTKHKGDAPGGKSRTNEPTSTSRFVKNNTAVTSKVLNSAFVEETGYFDGFIIRAIRDHILSSVCHHETTKDVSSSENCKVCEYRAKLSLPHLPDMVFPNNVLMIQDISRPNVKIFFNALDALRMVGPSVVWQQSRIGATAARQISSPFDWTYSTDYQGTVEGFKVEPTAEAIDMDKLMRRDPIYFYSQVALYEDELADHGCAQEFKLTNYWKRFRGCIVHGEVLHQKDKSLFPKPNRKGFHRDLEIVFSIGALTLRTLLNISEFEYLLHCEIDMKLQVLEYVLEPSAIWQHIPIVDSNRTKLIIPVDG